MLCMTTIKTPLLASMALARCPDALVHSSVPKFLSCALASSLLRPPSPSQYSTLAGPCLAQVSQYASSKVSFVLFGMSVPVEYRIHLSMMWNTMCFL